MEEKVLSQDEIDALLAGLAEGKIDTAPEKKEDTKEIKPFDFRNYVISARLRIPGLEVITYKKLAEKIGFNKDYRAVGKVLAKNSLPLIYPCHRVIGIKGLTGYSQGLLIKQFLLYRELNYKFFDKMSKR